MTLFNAIRNYWSKAKYQKYKGKNEERKKYDIRFSLIYRKCSMRAKTIFRYNENTYLHQCFFNSYNSYKFYWVAIMSRQGCSWHQNILLAVLSLNILICEVIFSISYRLTTRNWWYNIIFALYQNNLLTSFMKIILILYIIFKYTM